VRDRRPIGICKIVERGPINKAVRSSARFQKYQRCWWSEEGWKKKGRNENRS